MGDEKDEDNLTKALAAIPELRAVYGKSLAEMEQIDKEITFRRFYFYGTTVTLKTDLSSVTDFDPRYLSEYVSLAKHNGFYRHIVRWNPGTSSFVTTDFQEAWRVFNSNVSQSSKNSKQYPFIISNPSDSVTLTKRRDTVTACLAALLYFGKMERFAIEYGDLMSVPLDALISTYSQQIRMQELDLADFVGQAADEFQLNDYGWLAPEYLAFDVGGYVAKLESYRKEYEEYKAQLWSILKNCQSLALSGNYLNSTIVAGDGANVSISQMNQIVQQLQEMPQVPQPAERVTIEPAPYEEPVLSEDLADGAEDSLDAYLKAQAMGDPDDELDAYIAAAMNDPAPTPIQETPNEEGRKRITKKTLTIIIVIVAIIFLAALILFVMTYITTRRASKGSSTSD